LTLTASHKIEMQPLKIGNKNYWEMEKFCWLYLPLLGCIRFLYVKVSTCICIYMFIYIRCISYIIDTLKVKKLHMYTYIYIHICIYILYRLHICTRDKSSPGISMHSLLAPYTCVYSYTNIHICIYTTCTFRLYISSKRDKSYSGI
jgi:hypothetical protein